MGRMIRAIALAAAVTVVGIAAISTDGRAAGGGPDSERAISRLIERAEDRVEARRSCRPVLNQRFTTMRPTARLLATLGILRREQTDEERALESGEGLGVGVGSTYRHYVRIARSASGRAFVVAPGRDTGFFVQRSRTCRLAFRRRVARLVADRPVAFRRRAERALDRTIRLSWKRPRVLREQVFLLDYRPEDGAGGGVGGSGAREIRRRGMFGASETSRRPGAVLSGLVPDGVASIDFTFARKGSACPAAGRCATRRRSGVPRR